MFIDCFVKGDNFSSAPASSKKTSWFYNWGKAPLGGHKSIGSGGLRDHAEKFRVEIMLNKSGLCENKKKRGQIIGRLASSDMHDLRQNDI